MKMFRLIAVGVFLAAAAAVPASSQTKPAGAATPPQTAALAADGKIALVYSELFQDPKSGIARINVTMSALNREFQPRQTELNQLAKRVQDLSDEIQKSQGGDQRILQGKIDQLDQLKKDYQRKGEDGTAAYDKRKAEMFEPIQEDISKALAAYAKAHGISVLIDASAVPLVYAADAIDVTIAFINEYNSKNPATAVLNPPK